jgi:hypothetical protein
VCPCIYTNVCACVHSTTAPFPDVEAALRLMYSFAEQGLKNNKWVSEGTFPHILSALHNTDIAAHTHPQVLLAYYELSVRYVKYTDLQQTQCVCRHLTSVRGIRHPYHMQLRARSAYFLLKLAEAMEGKASALLPHVAPFGGELLDVMSLCGCMCACVCLYVCLCVFVRVGVCV